MLASRPLMVLAAPDDTTGMRITTSSGLRDSLRKATASAHRELDARFAAFDITSRRGYRRFLEASAAALWPLEVALDQGGVNRMFADWPERSRRAAIAADLDRVGGSVRPLGRCARSTETACSAPCMCWKDRGLGRNICFA